MSPEHLPTSTPRARAAFELLEHTADIGIAACGNTLAELFQATAEGLRQVLISAPSRVEQTRQLSLSGRDIEQLLVTWLQEILYLLESEQFLAAEFTIDSITPTALVATLGGAGLDPRRHRLEREVKAVTYHRLAVCQHDGCWTATVYLDL